MGNWLLGFIIDFLCSSVVMFGIYMLLFRYKSGYNQSRLFLIAIPFLSLVFSVVTLNVLPAPEVPETVLPVVEMSGDIQYVPENSENVSVITEPLSFFAPVIVQDTIGSENKAVSYLLLLLIVYVVVVLVRLGVLLYNVYVIRSTKRWSTPEKMGEELVYRSGYVDTPFSFLKDIFVSRRIAVDRLPVIVMHEKAHITHRHYIDKIFIELYATFMWFNPIVWLIRKELGAVHEFQSDATVIKSGVDLHDYQQLLFDEIEKNVPIVANGFNNSLIKKRFVMMRNGIEDKLPVLRFAILVPLLIAVFAFTSLGYRQQESDVDNSAVSESHNNETDLNLSNSNDNLSDNVSEEDLQAYKEYVADNNLDAGQVSEKEVVGNDSDVTKKKTKDTSDFVVVKTYTSEVSDVVKERNRLIAENARKADSIAKIADKKGAEINERAKQLNAEAEAVNERAKKLLAENARKADSIAKIVDKKRAEINERAKQLKAEAEAANERAKKLLAENKSTVKPSVSISLEDAGNNNDRKRNTPRVKINGYERYFLKPEQTVVYYGEKQGLANVICTDKETRVVLTVLVGGQDTWVFFSENTFLRDCETGDMYKVRIMDRDVPLAETIYISNATGSIIEFTMIFPPLGKDVKHIDFIQYNSNEGSRPTQGTNWKFSDIDLSAYPNKPPKLIL